jgi:hypothetical protein
VSHKRTVTSWRLAGFPTRALEVMIADLYPRIIEWFEMHNEK